MTDCSHGLSLDIDCIECEETIKHLNKCKECADLYDYKQPFRQEVKE